MVAVYMMRVAMRSLWIIQGQKLLQVATGSHGCNLWGWSFNGFPGNWNLGPAPLLTASLCGHGSTRCCWLEDDIIHIDKVWKWLSRFFAILYIHIFWIASSIAFWRDISRQKYSHLKTSKVSGALSHLFITYTVAWPNIKLEAQKAAQIYCKQLLGRHEAPDAVHKLKLKEAAKQFRPKSAQRAWSIETC